jgi:hypothetical protein
MSQKKIPLPWGLVQVAGTTAVFHPNTLWLPAADVKKVRGAFELAVLESDVTVSLAYQTANVENSLDTPTAIGSYATANGVSYPGAWADISAATEAKQLIRFGWLVKNTATSTKNFVRVGGFVQVSDS